MLFRPPESISQTRNGADYSAIKKRIMASYYGNYSVWQDYWSNAMMDMALEAGVTNFNGVYGGGYSGAQGNNLSVELTFNEVRPLGQQLKGYQQRNRKSVVVVPDTAGVQEAADQQTKLLLKIFERESVYDTVSDSFHEGAFVTGLSLMQIYMDWSRDPVNGDIKVAHKATNTFFMDSYFKDKVNLTDCSFIWLRSYVSPSTAANLLPDYYDDIMKLSASAAPAGRDGKFNWMPENIGLVQKNVYSYDEYYYQDWRDQTLIVDLKTNQTTEFLDDGDMTLDYFLSTQIDEETGESMVTIIKQRVPTIRLAIMIQDQVFYDGPSGSDTYDFVPVVGFYSSALPQYSLRVQGICRSLRSWQYMINRRQTLNAQYAESTISSGFIIKEDAVRDINNLMQTGPGKIIPIKKGYELAASIQPVPVQSPPAAYFQLEESVQSKGPYISGITEEIMGMSNDANSGYQTRLNHGAALTTLQPLFSSLDTSVRTLGEKILEKARMNYGPGKLMKLLDVEQLASYWFGEDAGNYRCTVELGFDTESQKQMQYLQLTHLKQMNVNIPDQWLINAAPIQNKNELLKSMADQAEQANKANQQEQQAQFAVLQAQINALNSKAQSDVSMMQERQAKAHLDREDAQYKRHRDEEASILNFIKAARELRTTDFDQIMRTLKVAQDFQDTRQEHDVTQNVTNDMAQQDITQEELPNGDNVIPS